MILIYLLLLAALCLWKITPAKGAIHEDYMNIPQTTAIRGVMACLIFCSHLQDYLPFEDPGALLYVRIIAAIGQYMVAPFFFFSGYGLVLSYRKKPNYEQGFLRKRLGLTWFHFAVAVSLFYLLDLALGYVYSPGRYLLSLTGWTDVGNSNWYMFDTFVLYLFMYLAMHMVRRLDQQTSDGRTGRLVVLLTLLTLGLILALSLCKGSWWYNTLLSFAFGGAFVLVKKPFEDFCRSRSGWWMMLLTAAAALILCRRSGGYMAGNLAACLFVLLITLVTMKLRIRNPILLWIGKHSFFIYIYMRIPMIFLRHFELLTDVPCLFAAASLILTLALAWAMNRLHKKIDPCFLPRA